MPPPLSSAQRAAAETLMAVALREAERGRGRTSPNPIVGALVARRGRIVGVGYHHRAGEAHGEVNALNAAGEKARGADLYVTLEPCDHFGRTPPCTRAVIAAGIKRVFIGSRDPNPKVSGRGIERLRKTGLEVHVGIRGAECDAANEGWFKFITTRTPWVALKAAITLDGRIATAGGDSKWITSEPARRMVHEWRDQLDAVLVGLGTVRADDPQLTARIDGGRDPLRVIVDSRLKVSTAAKALPGALLACTDDAPKSRATALEAAGAQIVRCRKGADGRVDLADLLAKLGERNVVSVLVEGGAALHGSLLAARLWDELRLFVAPKILGTGGLAWAGQRAPAEMKAALAVCSLQSEQVGPDVLLRARRQQAGKRAAAKDRKV